MLKLVYVRGISRYDTLKFNTLQEQEDFFHSKVVESIDAYYPPHYTNIIKVNKSELSLNTQVNYCILIEDGKSYYYFIDNITYINSSIYEITITMDVIQTYMFNIIWNESLVNRKSISRWNYKFNEYRFNRDYIRENLSLTEKNMTTKGNYDSLPFIIIKMDRSHNPNDTVPTAIIQNNKRQPNSLFYYAIPIFPEESFVNLRMLNEDNTERWSYSFNTYAIKVNDIIHKLANSTYVLNMYYVNVPYSNKFFNFARSTFTESGQTYTRYSFYRTSGTSNNILNNSSSSGIDSVLYTDTTTYPAIRINYINNNWNVIKENNFTFSRNTLKNRAFNLDYIPQLLDENYYDFKYGERNMFTTFPLHKLEFNTLSCQTIYDFISGYRIHRIIDINTDDTDNDKNDKWLTSVVNDSIETYDLYNDAWETYQASHKGDLTLGRAFNISTSLYKGSAGALSATILPSPYNILKGSRDIANIPNEIIGKEAQLQVDKINAENIADTIKCGNSYSSDLLSNGIKTNLFIYKSEDIESVAKKLEYNGYKVCEYTTNNLFNYANIRYYYNIIQCDYLNINLDILTTNDIINNIKTRFIDGLRLWNNVDNLEISDAFRLNYDNVEIEYLG